MIGTRDSAPTGDSAGGPTPMVPAGGGVEANVSSTAMHEITMVEKGSQPNGK